MGRRHLLITGRTGLGGTGSPAQGVVGTSCKAHGEPSSSNNRAHRPGGDGESSPGGVRSLLPGPMGGHLLQRTGRTGPGGTGSPAQGVFGVSCQANGGPSSSENRAHRPGGDGESCPGGVRSLMQGQWGAIFFSGQWNSCNALLHCLGAVDSATPAMRCLTVPEQWAVELLQCTTSLPWGSGQWNSCNALPHCLGAADSATSAMHCLTALGQWAVQLLQCNASLPGGSGQRNSKLLPRTASLPGGSGRCNFYNARPHCLGAVGSATLAMHCLSALGAVGSATPAMGGRSVVPGLWGCTTGRTGLGGWGVQPRGRSGHPSGPMGGHHLRRTGRTGLGGTGSPGQGVVGASCGAHGEASSANNRAHRPGGDGEPSLGGGRNLLQGPWGAIIFKEPGAPAWGGRGVLPRGWSEPPARANGGPSSSENRAHRPGGNGESCPGGVRSLLPGQWGATFFREPGAPARGGRGVLPRGCSESPARAMGGHLLQRTGRTGLGGTGSPAQGVFGVSCKASGGPSSSENRAHRPGGDGESCPGGVRSLLPGQWGAIFFREPGAPARGGRGVLPRGCSESPARPMGGHLLQRTGRTGPGGTGSPAQGVFGVSCKASGGPSSSVGSGTPAMHCPTAWGQWTVQLLQCAASLSQSSGQWNSCNALPHCPGAVGSGTLAMHCLTAWGQRTVQPLQCTASLPWVSGQCNSCNTLPHCLGAVGSGTPAMQCLTAWGQWPAQLQTPATHCLTAWGQRAVQLLQCTASLPGSSGQCNSCNALPQCHGGSGQCNSCNGWSECSAGPVGMYYWAHRPGGMGSPTQGAVGASFRAYGGPSSSENRAHRPGGDGEPRPGGGRSLLQGPWGGVIC